jgi:hypothetical protein
MIVTITVKQPAGYVLAQVNSDREWTIARGEAAPGTLENLNENFGPSFDEFLPVPTNLYPLVEVAIAAAERWHGRVVEIDIPEDEKVPGGVFP